MKTYENVQIRLTTHAHKRYCERVQHISYEELTDQCNLQLHKGEYDHNKNWFPILVAFGGVMKLRATL